MADINGTVLTSLSVKTVNSNDSTPYFQVGNSGVGMNAIRKSTVSVALGTVAGDSVTTSITVTGIAAGDPVFCVAPASQWSGAYHDISLSALATATDTVVLAARNSTTTGINTTAQNMDLYWIDLA